MDSDDRVNAGPSRYREISVAGSPRTLGRQIGEAAREEVRGFCDVAMDRVNQTIRISRARAMEIAQQSLTFAEDYRPDLVDELRGTAEAAGVDLNDLMLLQVRNQLTAEPDAGCTSLSVRTADGSSLVAQTWDADPVLDRFTIILTRQPEGRPATMTCTQAGLISYMGFSETGFGACVNSLPAPSRPVGVPHYFTLRELYEATSLDQAVHAIERAHRAIPANIMLATPDGPADLEVTIDSVHVLRPDGKTWLGHTNHCVHAELCHINEQFPELIQSHSRKRRLDQLMMATNCDIEYVKQILRDHQDYPRSICRHSNEDQGHGFWRTVFALVIEPNERRMHVSRGTPCCHKFETYDMPFTE
ncbi:MAG: C45 family peptidase [Planctomycetaceae bacterium]